MQSVFCLFVLCMNLIYCSGASEEEICARVQSKTATQCRNLVTDCPEVYQVFQARGQDPNVRATLQKLHCGFENNAPKVCCPVKSPTPDNGGATQPSDGDAIEKQAYVDTLPEAGVCGVSRIDPPRVVGGIDAKLGDFPWMALLGYKSNEPWKCGGSVITSRHVLTAAHCVVGTNVYVVRFGELDYARTDEGATPLDILIKHKIIHEEYKSTNTPSNFVTINDIAILIVERDVEFTDLIRPVCLPTRPDLRSNTFEKLRPFVAGWGQTKFRGVSSSHLKYTQLPVMSNADCQAAYRDQAIDQRIICAGYKQGMKDACGGDSGGPLMLQRRNPETSLTFFYQIGVVSFGMACASPGVPGVYTRVTEFLPWISKKVTGKNI